MQSAIRPSRSDKVFYCIDTLLLSVLLLIVLYPLYFVVIASVSNVQAVAQGEVLLWPKGFQLIGFQHVLRNQSVLTGYRNTIFYTLAGTLINALLTMAAGYGFTIRFPGRRFLLFLILLTMYFSGGMVPMYLLMRDLRLLDTVWAMLLPGAVSAYLLMMARTFLQSNISHSLYEAAQMDGCSRIRFFVTVVLPLSGVLIAILALYYGVGHWNSYMGAILYLTDRKRFPLQLVLREILILNKINAAEMEFADPELIAHQQQLADIMKYALIIVSSVPMLVIYPFLQRYFVKGVMVGSIKE